MHGEFKGVLYKISGGFRNVNLVAAAIPARRMTRSDMVETSHKTCYFNYLENEYQLPVMISQYS